MDYLLSYAGVPFVEDQGRVVRLPSQNSEFEDQNQLPPRKHQPVPDLIEEVDRLLSFHYTRDYTLPNSIAGRNLSAIAAQQQIGPNPEPEIRIGDWYYPTTASRWSVFRGLATSSMVKSMVSATNGGATAATFVMKSIPNSPGFSNTAANFTISTSMRMLPPRPLAEHGAKFDGLYLVTLVDDRWYFQGTPCTLRVTKDTTWTTLLSQLATSLGISLTLPTIPAVYSQPDPDSQFWVNMEETPTLLDAVAYNIGCVLVRNLNGTYSLPTYAASAAQVSTNRGSALTIVRVAGGDIFSSGVGLNAGNLCPDRNSVVPQTIYVTYPKYVIGNDPVPHYVNPRYQPQRPSCWYEESYGDVYTVPVGIGSGGIFVSGLTGVSQKTLRSTAKALYSGDVQAVSGGTPLNSSGLTALSMQIASDQYAAQVASALDEVYPGTYLWTPEGIHDIIWSYSPRQRKATTRVVHAPWTQEIVNYQHAGVPLAGSTNTPVGVGGPSVAQTWRDSFTGPENTTLSSPLSSGGFSASLTSTANFPNANRWRGRIDNETILFEAASGNPVGIVYRGIDGSLQSAHSAGARVSGGIPNVTYGANLVTFQEPLRAYPGAWTSGGIQEVVVNLASGGTLPPINISNLTGPITITGNLNVTGTTTLTGTTNLTGSVVITSYLYTGGPSAGTITIPGGNSKIGFSPGSGVTIQVDGFTGGVDGMLLYVYNHGSGSGKVVLKDANATPASANMIFPNPFDYTLYPGDEIILEYDGVNSAWYAAVPTLAAGGTSTPSTYGCKWLKAGSNITMTDNADGTNTIAATGGSSTTGTNGSANIASNYAVTNAYADVTGLSVTLPNVGTYLILVDIQASMSAGLLGTTIVVQLVKNGVAVGGTVREAIYVDVAGTQIDGSCSLTQVVTTTGVNQIVKVQAQYTGTPTSPIICGSVGAPQNSSISYVQLS